MLVLSLLFNVGFFLYTRNVVANLLRVSEELGDFQQMIGSFVSHLRSVYELENFYGDQTLQGLLKHSRTLLNEMYDFQEKYQTSEEIDFDETEEDPPP